MDKYLIKRPRLSAELPRNPPGLCDAADDLPPRHGGTSAPSMDTLGAISAATADTPRSASLSAPNGGNVLESASKNGGATTGKPSTHGRLEQTRPGPTNGNGGRGFRKSWQSTYSWLSYNAQTSKVYCDICVRATDKKLPLPRTSRDKDSLIAFVETGFQNWKKALQRFKSHENSALHRAASTALTALNVGLNVASALSESKQNQMKESRKALMAILSSIRFLAFQGLALRGHDDDEGNLKQLLLLREADVPGLAAWLSRTGYKWISGDIQNEMLELITHSMLRSLMKEVHGAGFYAVIADETSDITTQEQVSFCLRYAKENLEVEEVFVGFYATADTRARTLFSILKDVLCRFNLRIENCRGQCYDGAANVSGKSGGLQALVQEIEPRALYVHCLAHTLNLSLQDLCTKIDVCRDFVSLFTDLVNFVRTSPKRLSWFQQFQKEENPALRQFCKTRWTLKARSLRSVSANYSELTRFLFTLSSEEKNDTGAKASGYAKTLQKFDTYFLLRLMLLVFERLESVNSALQKKSLQFTRAQHLVKAVEESIGQLRDDFSSFWADVSDEAREMDIGAPRVSKRPVQAPRRYDEGSRAHDFNSPEALYRQRFYLVIDTVHASLRTRFPPEMWHHMKQVEQFVTGDTDGTYLCEFYKGDLNAVRLQLHRNMLLDIAKQRATSLVTFQDVVDFLSGKAGEPLRVLLPEVVKLLQIAMTIPVTSCSSERSFSCLQRVKTYLRSTMGQARLNHTALLHCHKEQARQVDLNLVANEFIHRTVVRENTFHVEI